MTTVFHGFPFGLGSPIFAPNMKIVCKRFGGYNQNDYLCSAFISNSVSWATIIVHTERLH